MPTHPPPDTDAMSTASTLVPSSSEEPPQQQVRTTLTGRPIVYQPDNLNNLWTDTSFQAGANTLPPGYTDSSLVHIPIKTAQYLHSRASEQQQDYNLGNDVVRPSEQKPKKENVFSRLSSKLSSHGNSGSSGKDSDGLKIVAMSRGDYLKYWAKGEDGKFRDDVVEPPGGRAEWLARAIETREREGLGKVTPQHTRGTYGSATAFGAAGAMIGGVVN